MSKSVVNLFKDKVETNDSMTEKKKNILKVCIDLFAENGFASTSTSQIAKAAKVAEGTIFKHFGKKEDILIKNIIPFILENLFPVLVNDFSDAIDPSQEDFEKFIYAIVRDRVLFLSENKKLAKILITEVMYREELRKRIFEIVPAELKQKFYKIFDDFKAKGIVCDMDNNDILRFIATNIFSYAIVKITIDGKLNDEEEIKKISTFLVKGLSK